MGDSQGMTPVGVQPLSAVQFVPSISFSLSTVKPFYSIFFLLCCALSMSFGRICKQVTWVKLTTSLRTSQIAWKKSYPREASGIISVALGPVHGRNSCGGCRSVSRESRNLCLLQCWLCVFKTLHRDRMFLSQVGSWWFQLHFSPDSQQHEQSLRNTCLHKLLRFQEFSAIPLEN